MARFCIAVPVLSLALAASAIGEDVHAIAQGVDEHYNHLQSLEAEFTEVYRGSGMERTESGTLWLAKGGAKKPGKMRWEYRSPREKLFVSDGRDAWFYVPGDRQVRKTVPRSSRTFGRHLRSCLVRAGWKRNYRVVAGSGCDSH